MRHIKTYQSFNEGALGKINDASKAHWEDDYGDQFEGHPNPEKRYLKFLESKDKGWSVGDKVHHKKFGVGQVITVGPDDKLTVIFAGNTKVTAPATIFGSKPESLAPKVVLPVDDDDEEDDDEEYDDDEEDDDGEVDFLSVYSMGSFWWPKEIGDDFDKDTLEKLAMVGGRGMVLRPKDLALKMDRWIKNLSSLDIKEINDKGSEIIGWLIEEIDDKTKGLAIVGGDFVDQVRLFMAKSLVHIEFNQSAAMLARYSADVRREPYPPGYYSKAEFCCRNKFWLNPAYVAEVAGRTNPMRPHINYIMNPPNWKSYLHGLFTQHHLRRLFYQPTVTSSHFSDSRMKHVDNAKLAKFLFELQEPEAHLNITFWHTLITQDNIPKKLADAARTSFVSSIIEKGLSPVDIAKLDTLMDVGELANLLSALKNPERLFEVIRRYINTHNETPTNVMAAARRAFTEEYDREFGDDDFSAEMGELGI